MFFFGKISLVFFIAGSPRRGMLLHHDYILMSNNSISIFFVMFSNMFFFFEIPLVFLNCRIATEGEAIASRVHAEERADRLLYRFV